MTQYIINPHLCILSINGDVFVHLPDRLKSYTYQMLRNKPLQQLFEFMDRPQDLTSITNKLNAIFPEKNHESIKYSTLLIDTGILVRVDHKVKSGDIWADNNWSEAYSYHLHTNHIPKIMYNVSFGQKTDSALMDAYLEAENSPDNYKHYDNGIIYLKKPKLDKTLTVSNIGKNHCNKTVLLNSSLLSWILYYAFGQIGIRYMQETGAHIRKTVPSGGARHPIEVYFFLACPLGHITPGIYHYNVEHHGLVLIKKLSSEAVLQTIRQKILLDENRPGFDIQAAFVYSCVFERSMFRYRESRSYRVMQFDLGHILQNFYNIVGATNCAVYNGYSLNEKDIEKIIGLDPLMESCMAYSVI